MGSGRSLASQRICARAVGIGGAGDSARLSYAYCAQAHARLSVACSRALAAGRVGVIAGSTLERSVCPQRAPGPEASRGPPFGGEFGLALGLGVVGLRAGGSHGAVVPRLAARV